MNDGDELTAYFLRLRRIAVGLCEVPPEQQLSDQVTVEYRAATLRDAIDDFLESRRTVPAEVRDALTFAVGRMLESAFWLGNLRLENLSPLHTQLAKNVEAQGMRKARGPIDAARHQALDAAINEVAAKLKITPAISSKFADVIRPDLRVKLGYSESKKGPSDKAIKDAVRRIKKGMFSEK